MFQLCLDVQLVTNIPVFQLCLGVLLLTNISVFQLCLDVLLLTNISVFQLCLDVLLLTNISVFQLCLDVQIYMNVLLLTNISVFHLCLDVLLLTNISVFHLCLDVQIDMDVLLLTNTSVFQLCLDVQIDMKGRPFCVDPEPLACVKLHLPPLDLFWALGKETTKAFFFLHCALRPQKPQGLLGTGEGGGRGRQTKSYLEYISHDVEGCVRVSQTRTKLDFICPQQVQ